MHNQRTDHLTHLLAILVGNNRAGSRTRIGAKDNTTLKEAADDGGTRACRVRELHAVVRKIRVPSQCVEHRGVYFVRSDAP